MMLLETYSQIFKKKNGQSDDATRNLQLNFKKMTNLNLKILKL